MSRSPLRCSEMARTASCSAAVSVVVCSGTAAAAAADDDDDDDDDDGDDGAGDNEVGAGGAAARAAPGGSADGGAGMRGAATPPAVSTSLRARASYECLCNFGRCPPFLRFRAAVTARPRSTCGGWERGEGGSG